MDPDHAHWRTVVRYDDLAPVGASGPVLDDVRIMSWSAGFSRQTSAEVTGGPWDAKEVTLQGYSNQVVMLKRRSKHSARSFDAVLLM